MVKKIIPLFISILSFSTLVGCNSSSGNPSPEDPHPEINDRLDYLEAMFEDCASLNLTIKNDGYGTEYYMDGAYYIDYIDYLEDQSYNDFGYIDTKQALCSFIIENNEVQLKSAFSFETLSTYITKHTDNPKDLYDYARYEVEEPYYFAWHELENFEIPETQSGDVKAIYENNHGVFESTYDQAITVSALLGRLELDTDEDGYYVNGSLDKVRCVIKSDYSLHFEVYSDYFAASIYDITNIGNTKLEAVEKFKKNPKELEKRVGYFTEEEISWMEQNIGMAIPFPKTYSFSFSLMSAGLSTVIMTDKASGDISAEYMSQLREVGFTETFDETLLSETKCDHLMIKNITEDGSKHYQVALSYSSPDDQYPRGFMVISFTKYPHSM